MRKLFLFGFILVAVVFAGIFILLPEKVHFRKTMYVQAAPNTAARFVLDQKAWHTWWPSTATSKNDTTFFYEEHEFVVNWKIMSGDSIIIRSKNSNVSSLLNLIPVNKDSFGIQWEGESNAETNFLKRIDNYFTQKEIHNNASEIFAALKTFLENDEKVYGLKIEHKMVVDTLLISTKKIFTTYPTTQQVYELVDELKSYIKSNDAVQTNPPMLHVVQDSGLFKTMVAIPINKALQNTNSFAIKKMVAGKILISQIKGGSSQAEAAIKKIELYMDDYHLLSPAISYQSLVSDRTQERDSTKWVTKVYYPVM